MGYTNGNATCTRGSSYPHHAESIIVDSHEDRKFKREYLVECGGEIMSILVGDLGKSILVYRFDRQKKGW
ncbi:unnamed protein product [Linum trigynum]|uniref:Uncharacterized protein n=1 Tax=Linum trigynum TaxID=586398 RepID=A0AAV2FK04_9ROSI